MKELQRIPNGLEEIIDYYGHPDPEGKGKLDPSFEKEYIRTYDLPFTMRLGWDTDQKVTKARFHKKIGDVVVDALEELATYISGDVEYLRRNDLDLWWGSFNFRAKVSGGDLSTHSWGIAFDINKHIGEYGEKPEFPDWFVKIFTKRGFIWGGDWSTPDGQHFQAAKGY